MQSNLVIFEKYRRVKQIQKIIVVEAVVISITYADWLRFIVSGANIVDR